MITNAEHLTVRLGLQWNRARYQNLQRYRAVIPATARLLFTVRCYEERGYAAVCCLSVSLSARLGPSVCDVPVPSSHKWKYFKNNFTAD